MRSAGLALGGSLQNAIVLDETRVLNSEGLRYDNEFVQPQGAGCDRRPVPARPAADRASTRRSSPATRSTTRSRARCLPAPTRGSSSRSIAMTRFRPRSRTGRSSAPLDPRPAAAVPFARRHRRGIADVAHQARSSLPALHRPHASSSPCSCCSRSCCWFAAERVVARSSRRCANRAGDRLLADGRHGGCYAIVSRMAHAAAARRDQRASAASQRSVGQPIRQFEQGRRNALLSALMRLALVCARPRWPPLVTRTRISSKSTSVARQSATRKSGARWRSVAAMAPHRPASSSSAVAAVAGHPHALGERSRRVLAQQLRQRDLRDGVAPVQSANCASGLEHAGERTGISGDDVD